jgi:hypothetical protein
MNRAGCLFALFVLLLALGCGPSTTATQMPAFTHVPTPSDPTPADVEAGTKVVSLRISEATTAQVRAEIVVGNLAEMRVVFDPVIYQVSPGYTREPVACLLRRHLGRGASGTSIPSTNSVNKVAGES